MINLKCTSCGATLDIPDNLRVAHCIYCGAKIIITELDSHKNRAMLKSYADICEAALLAHNYLEALDYCNKILEIDSKDADAWINKAKVTFWLTTKANNRYNEAMSYLDKAMQIDPNKPRIEETKKDLTSNQISWLSQLSTDTSNYALEIFKIYITEHNPQSLAIAREKSKEYWIEAANYALQVSYLDPENMDILERIYNYVSDWDWISWSYEFRKKAQIYNNYKKKQEELEKKKQAFEEHIEEIKKLPKFREALQKAEINLSNVKHEKGLFAGRKVKEAEDKVKELIDYIASLEKIKLWEDL